ncbi:MAG: hypothetical protein FJZ90_12370, partial [Chloroflexi bacterium]|nr:hypothetical protein [Chloroflexota bacterium]
TLRDLPLDVRLKIDPDLHKALLEARSDAERRGVPPEPLTYLVSLKARASFHDLAASPSPEARRQLLVERLQATAAQSQAPVVSYLSAQRARGQVSDYRSYWVFNGLAVDGDLETALALAAMPEVEAVRANRPHRLPTPSSAPGLAIAGENIRQIGADRVWSELGVTGEGIVVANLDSGVDWTHPALREQYRGYNPQNPAASVHDYNWFDATDTYPNAPGPNQGRLTAQSDHGTHTMGTMVGAEPDGSNQVGVAPGARWIAAKVFDNAGNSWDEWIHAGFQWCIAPTDLNGQTPDPSKAPHIVNCSWGDSNSLDDTFVQDVAALREAGIMSIWAAGNDGPGASTISSPASFPGVFGVGAVDSGNVIAQFSSRGPSPFGGIKPEVVAPGVRIRSTVAGGGYESSWNGTSMAAPHVAGVVALMWEAADGRISITDTERILTVVGTGIDLGQEGPDNVYGYGLVQAPAAVEEAIRWAKAYGYLFGWVRNALTGAPIEGARLVATDARTRERRETATDASGFYRLMLPSGRYDVTASEFLHESGSVSGVNVLSGVATQLDLRLQPAKAGVGVLAGKVTSRATGAPIAATVRLAGTIAQAKTDAQGEYQLLAPAGSYAVRITANVPGYLGEEVAGVTVRPQETTRVDRSLDAIPRILLVDAEAWRGDRGATYQAQALDVLLYSHDLWQVRNPPSDVPSANKMGSYDVVIWVQPKYSPGYISAWGVLGAYLDGGGALLMSGQDIGYWDQAQGYAPTDYRRFLGVRYQADDGGLGVISGLAGKLLDGLQLTPNTTDSAANQTEPDALALADALTEGVCTYPSGQLAGVQLSACLYRAVYFGFGLEGVGPLASRAEAMRRAISWLVTPQTKEGVRVLLEQQAQGATIGTTARYPLTLANSGSSMDSYTLVITSPTWPARLVDAATRRPITETSMLAPCGRSELWLEVSVPADARTAAEELTRVEVRSKRFAGATATVAVATTAIQPWESGPAMAVARYRLAVAAQGCQLYAIGGFDREDRALSSVGILDTTTRAWRSGSPKPTVSGNSAAVALAGAIHLL